MTEPREDRIPLSRSDIVPEERPARRPRADGEKPGLPKKETWNRRRDLLFWLKLQSVAMCVLLVVMTYFSISTSIKIHKLDRSIEIVEHDLEELKIEDVNQAIASLTAAADNLAKIDMDAFNDVVESLRKVTDTLEKVSDTLSKVTDAIGSIGSLFGH